MDGTKDELAELRGQQRHAQQYAIVREYRQHMAADEAALEAEILLLEARRKTLAPAVDDLAKKYDDLAKKKYGDPAPEDWPDYVRRTWEARRGRILSTQRALNENPARCRAMLDKIRDGEGRRGRAFLKSGMQAIVAGDRRDVAPLLGTTPGVDATLAEIETLTALHDEAYASALAAARIGGGPVHVSGSGPLAEDLEVEHTPPQRFARSETAGT